MELISEVLTAVSLLEKFNYEAYLVGGAVRDYIINKNNIKNKKTINKNGNESYLKIKKIFDYDITTNAKPNEIKSVFKEYKTVDTGIKHGTVTVIINDIPLEITTYRFDGIYINNRKPKNVVFAEILKEDIVRRDFTINALAYNPNIGLVDYCGGEKDINQKLIRCVGNADIRFKEDALRILRALRFASVLKFNIENNTKAAIYKNKNLLKNISAERIFAEFKKLICGKTAAEVLKEYLEVFEVFIPKIICLNNDFDFCALNNLPENFILRFSFVFKEISLKYNINTVENILNNLKADNYTKENVLGIINNYNIELSCEKPKIKYYLNKVGVETFKNINYLKQAEIYNKNETELYKKILLLTDNIIKNKECIFIKDLAVNGNDILPIIKDRKNISLILKECLKAVTEEKIKNDKTEILSFISLNFNKYLNLQ